MTSFRPKKPIGGYGIEPLWFDRPCFENDVNEEPGHRFMCECEVTETT